MVLTTRYCANQKSIPSNAVDIKYLWHYRANGLPDNWNSQTNMPFGYSYSVSTEDDFSDTRIIEKDFTLSGSVFPDHYHLMNKVSFMGYYSDEFTAEDVLEAKKEQEFEDSEDDLRYSDYEDEDYALEQKFEAEKQDEINKIACLVDYFDRISDVFDIIE